MRRRRSVDGLPDVPTARISLHGDLVELLRSTPRPQPVDLPVAQGATIKHLIETLDVPHTEVGAVTVDGRPADLGRMVAAGEHIDAYPARPGSLPASDDASAPARQSPESDARDPARNGDGPHTPGRAGFLADAHLGALARLLRLVGFDTVLATDGADSELAARAQAESRIVLSCDRELLKHRRILRGRLIRSRKPDDQLAEVLERFGLKDSLRPFTRCLECNAQLQSVARSLVEHRLPPGVMTGDYEFTRCAGCDRVYWQGSHWQKLSARIDAIRHRLG
jgi:uncharacterized protein with PIN domain